MALREEEPLEKVPTRFFKSDLDWARRYYSKIGYNKVIRLLLRKHRQAVEKHLARKRAERGESEDEFDFGEGIDEPIGQSAGERGDQPADA